MNEEGFFGYARSRHNIYLARQAGAPRAEWTQDPILQKFRFCNVFRELDRVTIWFRENLREPLGADLAGQLRAAVIFRYLNRIETGEEIKGVLLKGMVLRFALDDIEHRLREVVAAGRPILNGAYMIKTPLRKDKVTGLLEIWRGLLHHEDETALMIFRGRSLQAATELLAQGHYVGPFMAYEIVTDLRHTQLLSGASDIMTWANPGPGAMRGASRVAGLVAAELSRSNKAHVAQVMELMQQLLAASRDPFHWPAEWPAWEMRDVEHNLCEFDKYERARLLEGAPKQLYKETVS